MSLAELVVSFGRTVAADTGVSECAVQGSALTSTVKWNLTELSRTT